MDYKKINALIITMVAVAFLCSGCLSKRQPNEVEKISEHNSNNALSNPQVKKKVVKKEYDLYSKTPYDLPLFSIAEISKLPLCVKTTIDKILEESQGFYLLRSDGEKVLVILQNPATHSDTYQRHGLQFAVISMDGKVTYHNAGYSGIEGEIITSLEGKDDLWVFDETSEPFKPLKHIVYDEKGKIKFTEIWNYDDEESVKYLMKDSNKKVVSILKESQDDASNLRREHVFYDNEGNTKMSLSINFDGANISRVSFYNSHDSIDSMSIFSEYIDGFRTKELIYNEDYQLINTVTSEYINGERKSIKVYCGENVIIDIS